MCTNNVRTYTIHDTIEEHLVYNNLVKENLSGFTKKGRVENNLMALKYSIEKSFKERKTLYVTAVHFAKAYDSVKRDTLIGTLKEYRVHPNFIEIIADIYTDDVTSIKIGKEEEITMRVSGGIKQGGTASTTLFKIITYTIIDKLEKEGGFKDEFFKSSALFFADDGLLISRTQEEMGKMINVLTDVSHTTGLKTNKDKSNVLIFNSKIQIEETNGIKVASDMKYLGITVTNMRNCFKTQKEKSLQKAKKLANLTYPILAQSCKSVVLEKCGTTLSIVWI